MADELLIDDVEAGLLQDAHTQLRAAYGSRHIVFVGFMGAGKSSMARLTARALARPWYDSDELIVQRSGRSIRDFFESGEEAEFRRWERQLIGGLLLGAPSVLALGGGAFEDARTRAVAFERGFVVNLFIGWRDFQAQLPKLRETRPLLRDRGEGEIHDLFLHRQMNYRDAHMCIRVRGDDYEGATRHLLTVLATPEAERR